MTLHSFHLAEVSPCVTLRAVAPPRSTFAGLRHLEPMWTMRLGAPLVSSGRAQLRQLAVFADWDDEAALDRFLSSHWLGRELAGGWHVRLEFLRRWGQIDAFPTPESVGKAARDEPVVAVTLARMRLPRLARFLHWGRPVERFVRDHPGQTLALAAMRPPHTVSTFTVWSSLEQMLSMTHGGAMAAPGVADPDRHARAMAEHARKSFHHEFTTLRFRCLSEHGFWQGRNGIVPRTRTAPPRECRPDGQVDTSLGEPFGER